MCLFCMFDFKIHANRATTLKKVYCKGKKKRQKCKNKKMQKGFIVNSYLVVNSLETPTWSPVENQYS